MSDNTETHAQAARRAWKALRARYPHSLPTHRLDEIGLAPENLDAVIGASNGYLRRGRFGMLEAVTLPERRP